MNKKRIVSKNNFVEPDEALDYDNITFTNNPISRPTPVTWFLVNLGAGKYGFTSRWYYPLYIASSPVSSIEKALASNERLSAWNN